MSNITSVNSLINFAYGFCSTDCALQGIQLSGGPTNLVGGTYSQSFLVSYAFSPATGTLDVTAAGVAVSASIATSPQVVTLTGLPANGQSVDVTASFSSNSTCNASITNLYQAPEFCNNDDVCSALDITNKINGAAVSCNNIGATAQMGEPKPNSVGCYVQNGWCDNAATQTVWFKFTTPASGSIDLDFTSPIDLQMALWEANDCHRCSAAIPGCW